ncbi:hypothetical protein NPIL_121901 [Nephila pilipes]|uniref:Uncharacterized protein n=1 Tax=Nephila pilipes TaxID=299642 RepID=A0A8X6MV86_NEPPI|nr:hypothetical protein NPIL_121901 [Nephila pilipes]
MEFIKEKTGYDFFAVEVVNAVQTRSQTEAKKKGNDSSKINVIEKGDDAIIISPENNDQISIPAQQKDIPELALMKIKREDFIKARKIMVILKRYTSRFGVKQLL